MERLLKGDGVLKGTLFLTISTLLVKLLGVIYKIPLSNYLGDEGMGYFNSAYTVFSFFYIICTAGVPKAVMILTGESKATGSIDEEKIVGYSLTAFLILGSFMTAFLILFAPAISNLIGSKKTVYSLMTIAPSIIFVSLSGVIRGKMTAEMNFLSIAVSQIIEAVGRLSLGLIFAYIGIKNDLGIEIVSAFTIFGVTMGALFSLIYLFICYKKVNSQKKKGQKNYISFYDAKKTLRKLFKISVPITLSAAVMSLTNIIDLGLIMKRLTSIGYTEAEASSLYGNYTTLAISMFNLAIALITPISVTFLPIFSKYSFVGKREELINSVNDSLKLSSLVGSPIMLGLMLYSEEILSLIFKNTEIKVGAELLFLLSPSIFFMFSLLIINSLLEATKELRAPIYSMLIGSAFKIIISYFLVSNPYVGIYAAPIGTVVSYGTALIVSLIIAEKKKGLSISIFSSVFPSFLIALISIGISLPIKNMLLKFLGHDTVTVIIILIVGIIYTSFLLFFGIFDIKELKKMAKYTKRI